MTHSYADADSPTVDSRSAAHVPKCRVCRAVLADGTRWCTHCGVNIMSHVHGRLASPARRLAATVLDFVGPIGAFIVTARLSDGDDIFELLLLGYVAWVLILFSDGTTPGKRLAGIQGGEAVRVASAQGPVIDRASGRDFR